MGKITWKDYYLTFLETSDSYFGQEALNKLFPRDVDTEGLGKILAKASKIVAPASFRELFQKHAESMYRNSMYRNKDIIVVLDNSPLKKPYTGVYHD